MFTRLSGSGLCYLYSGDTPCASAKLFVHRAVLGLACAKQVASALVLHGTSSNFGSGYMLRNCAAADDGGGGSSEPPEGGGTNAEVGASADAAGRDASGAAETI